MWQFWKLFYDANTGILEWSFKIGYRADIGFTLVAKIFIPAGTVVGFYGGYVVDDDYTVSTYDFSLSDKIRLYLNFYDHKMSVVFGKKKHWNKHHTSKNGGRRHLDKDKGRGGRNPYAATAQPSKKKKKLKHQR